MHYLDNLLNITGITYPNTLSNGSMWTGALSQSASRSVSIPHAKFLAECYVDILILRQMAARKNISPGQLFATNKLPDVPMVKSGDFGEILLQSILQSHIPGITFPIFKWRYRLAKNNPIQGTDLIGFHSDRANPGPNDCLVTCEAKTRASTIKKKIVREAFDGAVSDYATRLADSLHFYVETLEREGNIKEALEVERYQDPHKSPYQHRLLAAIVHDQDTWDDAFLGHLPQTHTLPISVEVAVIKVENLADWIDEVRDTTVQVLDA